MSLKLLSQQQIANEGGITSNLALLKFAYATADAPTVEGRRFKALKVQEISVASLRAAIASTFQLDATKIGAVYLDVSKVLYEIDPAADLEDQVVGTHGLGGGLVQFYFEKLE